MVIATNSKKIHYASDLHLELNGNVPRPLQNLDANILILAGDICSYAERDNFSQYLDDVRSSCEFTDIIYVLGNHEYYGLYYDEAIELWSEFCQSHNITLLNDSATTTACGLNIYGSTLWTDLNQGNSANYVAKRLNDFSKIGNFSCGRAFYIHSKSKEALLTSLDCNCSTIDLIVTHHCPYNVTHSRIPKDELSFAFNCTDMDDIVDLNIPWIYGHTHDNKPLNSKPNLHTNQFGYWFEQGKMTTNFSNSILLEI